MPTDQNKAMDLRQTEVSLALEASPAISAAQGSIQDHGAQLSDADRCSSERLAPVSAIIPTKNRPDDLRRTVRTLLAQTLLPREVVIVDQSGDDQSYRAVQEEFAECRRTLGVAPELKYVHDPAISGVSAARNRSMTCADQATWLFLDDDVVMEPEFIAEMMGAYEVDPTVDGVSGVITNYVPMPFMHRLWMTVFARGPFCEKRLAIYWHADKLRDRGVFRVAGFSGGLMSFRREIASRGLFDTRVGDGEDVDFCLNLGQDKKFVISPRMRLQHLSSPVERSRKEPLWIERYAVTQSFLYHKHWRGVLKNAICYAWLCVGLGVATSGSAVRRSSTGPWRALIAGLRSGKQTAQRRN